MQTIPILIGVTILTFLLFHFVGGDPVLHFSGKNADPQTLISLRHEMGLDQPLVIQYFLYLKKIITFDWGQSWATSQPILPLFFKSLFPTLLLTVPAFLMTILFSVVLSLFVAHRRGFIDRLMVVSCLISMSVSFLVYIVLTQKWLAYDLNLFPVYGWESSSPMKYLFLPWLIYIINSTGPKVLLFRTVILEEIDRDYVRTAYAKGLSTWTVLTKHVLKNSLLPIVTLSMSQVPALITGSLLLEAYFGIPGLGGELATAIHGSDFPVIEALTVFGAMVYILFNILNDLFCAYLDPRTEF